MIIIPDIHGRTFWKDCINKENEKIIFLGDYLDPYPEEEISIEDSIVNFEDIIDFARENKDRVILLIGNHDAGYIWGTDWCKHRHSYKYHNDIHNLFITNLNLFKIAHEEIINGKRFVFSHAGLYTDWINGNPYYSNKVKEKYGEITDENIVKTVNQMFKEDFKPFINMLADCGGHYRGGLDWIGSCIWMDVREIEWVNKMFKINLKSDAFQIFGHTQLKENPYITEHYADVDCRKIITLNDKGELNYE